MSLAALQREEDVAPCVVNAAGDRRARGRAHRSDGRAVFVLQASVAGTGQLRAPARGRHRSSPGWSGVSRCSRSCYEPGTTEVACRGVLSGLAAVFACRRDTARPGRGRRASTLLRCSPSGHERTIRVCVGDHNAAAVAEICRRLDGLPLAIELAAARCRLLSPAQLAERLNTALADLGPGARDAPARQRTLRATIEWRSRSLADREKTYFARFGVFAGGATVTAAETVTGAGIETLDQLVAKSLLVARERYASTRVEMLDQSASTRPSGFGGWRPRRGARAALRLLSRAGRASRKRQGAVGPDRNAHLARLDADVDNLHAALGWAVRDGGVEKALRLCRALGPYWLTRARYADAVAWTERVLALPGAAAHPELRIRAHTINSWGALAARA